MRALISVSDKTGIVEFAKELEKSVSVIFDLDIFDENAKDIEKTIIQLAMMRL